MLHDYLFVFVLQIMPMLSKILLIFLITFLGVATQEECDKTKPLLSKCYEKDKYRWLVEVPKTEESCKGKFIPQPVVVPCDFTCRKGATFDRETIKCKDCLRGTFSLGGGEQYTFSSLESITSLPTEISLATEALLPTYENECKKKALWQIKGNAIQGDVQANCIITLTLRFKLVQAGAIIIEYSLPTSVVFGVISSRCDFATGNDADNYDEDRSDPTKENEFSLKSTGYGVWKEHKVTVDDAGDYKLRLFTMGINAFHFPFLIRSIVVEGSSSIQDCIPCPPAWKEDENEYRHSAGVRKDDDIFLGTYAPEAAAHTCKPCPVNNYASEEGSYSCSPCNSGTEYSDEGSAKCLPRPTCEAKHYRKVFIGCDASDTAKITYEPIQPKICIDGIPPPATEQLPCGTCNPGMYKNQGKCEFCPAKTYSNGTLTQCLSCENELSLLPGLYYKNWNELPIYLNRSYMSLDDPDSLIGRMHNQSWIPSINYISSQALPDTLSMLNLEISKGFRISDIAKTTKEYGTLYFKFSIQCQVACSLFLVSQDIFNDNDEKNWDVLSRWTITGQSDHKNITEYTYSIQHPDEVTFSWLFTSDDETLGTDEIRIYEIQVTNTKLGGSDRCVSCLNTNNQETECKSCTPGYILSNSSCVRCPPSSIASRVRPNDPVPTICVPCPNNTLSDDGISCYVPCQQTYEGTIEYNLQSISTLEFHGSKLFTQKGSGYFHVFNASICGKTSVTCSKTPVSTDSKRSTSQMTIESKLCRMGSVPDKNENITAVAYIDEFGEKLSNVSLSTLKYFPPLRSDYNLSDITLVYRANVSSSQSACLERITYLSLRCDHILEEEKLISSLKYQLQTPNDCATGTCDGCTFYFLLRTPFACPTCDESDKGYRTFVGPCKFGRQELRKIPHPYCAINLKERVESRRCSVLSTEIQIIIGLFIIIAGILISMVIFCWRKNRKLEYRYMQLIENNNPDDDTAVDNVCAQLSDEDDSGEEVQFTTQSKAKKLMNVVRKAIGKSSNNGRSDVFSGDSFLLANTSTNEA